MVYNNFDELLIIQRYRMWSLFDLNGIDEQERAANFLLSKQTHYLGWLIFEEINLDNSNS